VMTPMCSSLSKPQFRFNLQEKQTNGPAALE
jgi:hypothetical protein